MERERTELEGGATQDEREADQRQSAPLASRKRGVDLVEVKRVHSRAAERTVDEHDAHEEQRGAQAACDQVLHAGFERGLAATQVADEDVEADGRRFEADEQRHKVVGLREQHEGRGDDQEDMVIVRDGGGTFFEEADSEEAR